MVAERAQGSVADRAVASRVLPVFAMMLFVGFNLRTVILGVAPILPSIQHDLGLSYTVAGLLTSLPVLVMGGMAWPAALLTARVGERRLVALGLALLAAGTILRGVWPVTVPLFAFTIVLSVGIALAQTPMPALAREWFPLHVGLALALFSDGLMIGESVAATVTGPLVAHVFGSHDWAASFYVWSVPVLAALLLWLWLTPAARRSYRRVGAPPLLSTGPSLAQPVPRDLPQHTRSGVSGWHLGVLLGSGSLIFFGMTGWIASYNLARGQAAATPLALGVLNFAQLPVSVLVTIFAQRLAGRRWPFICAGAVALAAVAGWVVLPVAFEPVWAALLGGGSAGVFALGIALPALLAGDGQVARLSGAMLALSYSVAFLGPLLGGALWDSTHLSAMAFAPVAAAGLLLIVLGALLPARAAFGLPRDTRAPEQA